MQRASGTQHTPLFLLTHLGSEYVTLVKKDIYSHIFLIYDNLQKNVAKMATYTHDFQVVRVKLFFQVMISSILSGTLTESKCFHLVFFRLHVEVV